MVRAIIAGHKTVTRRVTSLGEINQDPDKWDVTYRGLYWTKDNGKHEDSFWVMFEEKKRHGKRITLKCPYGFPGDPGNSRSQSDVLWVRESFLQWGIKGLQGKKKKLNGNYVTFAADDTTGVMGKKAYRSPLFMPKHLAVRWLKLEHIRIERLHTMTENDAILEGIHFDKDSGYYFAGDRAMATTALACYRELWISLHGVESWDSNPWVWVVRFSVLSPKESQKHLTNAQPR